jgi:PGF-pre-PGF domain-containing protein
MKKGVALLVLLLFVMPFAAAYGVTFYNPAWSPQDGKIYDLVEAGQPYSMDVKVEDIAITKIIFTINRTINNGGITVYHLMSTPSSLPEVPDNDSYEFNEIKYTGFVPFDAGKYRFTYEFKVAKGWLQNMSVSRDTVALHSFDRVLEEWQTLPTRITGEDDSFVFYRSDGPAVHYLFIGKAQSGSKAELAEDNKKTAAQMQTDQTAKDLSQEPKPEQEELLEVEKVDLGKPSVQPQPSAPVPSPAPAAPVSEQDDSVLFGAILLIGLAVAAVIIYLIFTKKGVGYSVDKELNNYISESLKRGKTKEEVRNRLLEVGWHHERVDKALAKHKSSAPAAAPSQSMSIAEAKALAEKQKKELSEHRRKK